MEEAGKRAGGETARRPTIRDVARRAGVSAATVSYVLNQSAKVSAETRQRVLEAVRELGYRAAPALRAGAGAGTGTLGLVIPPDRYMSDPFVLDFIAGVGDAATERGYSLLLSPSRGSDADLEFYRTLVESGRVDGLILMEARVGDPRIPFLEEVQIPFVLFGRSLEHPEVPFLDVDNFGGARELVHALIEMGHHRIGYVGGGRTTFYSLHRLQGFQAALAERGIRPEPRWIREADWTSEGGRQATLDILRQESRPTALFVASDLMAIGALQAAAELGLQVPEDLSVAGFDDIRLASLVIPPLTTMSQPVYEIGRRLTAMLAEVLRGRRPDPSGVILPPRLVLRESTAPPRS
ncbi:MAG: LacI family DNA-binding transcriptional regulator [Bacillota bacterium]|nr:LacI family DNA-binding transcriptional regulator [Bacillota bacterium]